MPIKPENKARYPAKWADIRAGIRARSGGICEHEGCMAVHKSIGIWKAGVFFKLADAKVNDLGIQPGDTMMDCGSKVIEIILTVAHLDHTPENCDPANLRDWCQRHHLAYDQAHHLTNAYMTRKAKANTMELPL